MPCQFECILKSIAGITSLYFVCHRVAYNRKHDLERGFIKGCVHEKSWALQEQVNFIPSKHDALKRIIPPQGGIYKNQPGESSKIILSLSGMSIYL